MLPTSAAAQTSVNPTHCVIVPVTGTADGNALSGLFTITSFANNNEKFVEPHIVTTITDTDTGAVVPLAGKE